MCYEAHQEQEWAGDRRIHYTIGSHFIIQQMGESIKKHSRMLFIWIYIRLNGQVRGCFGIVGSKGGIERELYFLVNAWCHINLKNMYLYYFEKG